VTLFRASGAVHRLPKTNAAAYSLSEKQWMPHDNCRDLRRKAAGIVPAGGVLALELDAAGACGRPTCSSRCGWATSWWWTRWSGGEPRATRAPKPLFSSRAGLCVSKHSGTNWRDSVERRHIHPVNVRALSCRSTVMPADDSKHRRTVRTSAG